MKIVNQTDGAVLCLVAIDYVPGVAEGNTVLVEGIAGKFRVTEVCRFFMKHRMNSELFAIEDVTVFVIPISESAERLPHED